MFVPGKRQLRIQCIHRPASFHKQFLTAYNECSPVAWDCPEKVKWFHRIQGTFVIFDLQVFYMLRIYLQGDSCNLQFPNGLIGGSIHQGKKRHGKCLSELITVNRSEEHTSELQSLIRIS